MALTYLFRKLVYAQVLLGIVAFCMAEPGGNPGMLLIAGALAALSWYVVEGPSGRPLPQWVILLGAAAAIAWLGLDLWFSQALIREQRLVITAVGHFTMWLQILQLYGYKTNRDYALILVLGLMQMVGASILTVSIIFGVLLAAYCGVALLTVLLFQLRSTSDQVHEANQKAAPPGVRVDRPEAVAGRNQRWHFRALAGSVGAVCVAVAALVFVLLPRTSRFQTEGAAPADALRQVGFSAQVQLDNPPAPTASHEPVLNLMLDPHGAQLSVATQQDLCRLRGAALDTYVAHRHTWERRDDLRRLDATCQVPDEGLALAGAADPGPAVTATITLRSPRARVLFAPGPASFISGANLDVVTFNPLDQRLIAAKEGTATPLTYHVRRPVTPTAALFEAYRHDTPTPPLPMAGRFGAPRLTLADLDARYARGWVVETPRVRELALTIIRAAGLDRDPAALADPRDHRIAAALEAHLRSRYAYSLTPAANPTREEPITHFLFTRREGHCEVFASALAALARALGLRARVVTGYLASDYNHIGGYYVVRQSDAHAWTEIDCPGEGWVTFDATPPAALEQEHAVRSGWFSSLRELYEHLEFSWVSSVVAYDKETRQAMFESIQQRLAQAANDPQTWAGWLPRMWRGWRTASQLDLLSIVLGGVIVASIGLASGILVRLYVVRRRRLQALRLHSLPPADRRDLSRRLGFYLTMVDMLERHGHQRPAWQSPLAFAQDLARRQPRRFEPAVALTQAFYDIRFGHHPNNAQRRQDIRGWLRKLEETLGEG